MAQEKSFSPSVLAEGLVSLQVRNGLLLESDRIFLRNKILHAVGEFSYTSDVAPAKLALDELLRSLAEVAAVNGRISKDQSKDFMDFLGSFFAPLPSLVNERFHHLLKTSNVTATNYLMELSRSVHYVKTGLKKDLSWRHRSKYGNLLISINTSKPEKTPEEIEAARRAPSTSYPLCGICVENIGYGSAITGSSRYGLRAVDLVLGQERMFMHFSPYGYFADHLVVNSYVHEPMLITKHSVAQILDFVETFPNYFLASNSDIPIVGGSILSHRHFQGGHSMFPLQRAKSFWSLHEGASLVEILQWPIPAIRISGSSKKEIAELFDLLKNKWYGYENPSIDIFKESDQKVRQNAVAVFGAQESGRFALYILLRNNGTSKEYPAGIFHAHPSSWNIKRENIGIIEQIGMAILPGRLEQQLAEMSACFAKNLPLPEALSIHREWFGRAVETYDSAKLTFDEHLKLCVGSTFVHALEDCGVFKGNRNDDLIAFVKSVFTNHD